MVILSTFIRRYNSKFKKQKKKKVAFVFVEYFFVLRPFLLLNRFNTVI